MNLSFEMEKRYIGLDGDSIGRKIESYLISGEEAQVIGFSKAISSALEAVRVEVVKAEGRVLFCSGDSILFHGDFDLPFCKGILKNFKDVTGSSASIGIGRTLPEVYLGLKLAKSKGGNQAIVYTLANSNG